MEGRDASTACSARSVPSAGTAEALINAAVIVPQQPVRCYTPVASTASACSPLTRERRGGRSVSASVARGARDGFCCCAGRGVGPRRARCGVVPAFHTEGTHAAAPVLGRGPLPRVGLTTNQLEDRRWPTRALSLHCGATRPGAISTISRSGFFVGASVLVLVPRCIWAVACIWLTQRTEAPTKES